MKKQKFTKLSLGKSRIANFNKVFGGGWNQGPTYTASQIDEEGNGECATASCFCNGPGDDYFISKGGGCPSIDPNNGNQLPLCDR